MSKRFLLQSMLAYRMRGYSEHSVAYLADLACHMDSIAAVARHRENELGSRGLSPQYSQ